MILGARLKVGSSVSATRAAAAAMLALAAAAALPAQTSALEQAAVAEPAKPSGRGVTRHPARSGIDARMQLLTAELDLDASQQAQVRRILEEQRALTLQAWSDESVPSAVRVKTTQVVAEQTAARIRAVLNDKQRARYIKPRPPETPSATTSADVEHYIEATERK